VRVGFDLELQGINLLLEPVDLLLIVRISASPEDGQ
jgi:hypothetical protein